MALKKIVVYFLKQDPIQYHNLFEINFVFQGT